MSTINKGAGGKNTNKNGLSYEDITDISKKLSPIETKKFGKGKHDVYNIFEINNKQIIRLTKKGVKNYLKMDYNKSCEKFLEPDECFVDLINKRIYILEKKFQQCDGSVDEKIQTAHFKYEYYCELYHIL